MKHLCVSVGTNKRFSLCGCGSMFFWVDSFDWCCATKDCTNKGERDRQQRITDRREIERFFSSSHFYWAWVAWWNLPIDVRHAPFAGRRS